LQLKLFPGVISHGPHSRGKGSPRGVGKGQKTKEREGREREERGWRGHREEKGEEGRKGEERGGEGQGGEWGKELWRSTFECLPPRLLKRMDCLTWSTEEVAEWLTDNGFGAHRDTFSGDC
jgi:hypothetical protein